MKLTTLLTATVCLATANADPSITYPAKDGPGKGKHIVFLAGDEEYRSEEGLPMLAKILSQRHGFKCTVLFSLAADGIRGARGYEGLSQKPNGNTPADDLFSWR